MYIVLNVMNAMLGVFNAVWQEEKVTEEVGRKEVVIKLMGFGMNFRVKWMFEEDWEEDMLDRLETWSQEWQLLFNRGKCKVMHFGKNNPRQVYTMGGQQLEASQQEKDLGVLVDESLKPSAQCAKAAAKY